MKRSRLISLYSIAIIFIGIVYYLYVFKNPQTIIKSKIENQFMSDMMMKTILIDNTIAGHIQGAKSISSRTMIRQKAVDFTENKITYEKLQEYTVPKYIDGTHALNHMLFARRYIDSLLLVSTDSMPCPELHKILKDTAKNTLFATLGGQDNISVTYVISPIENQELIIGYDILCFDNSNILSEISDSTIQFGLALKHHSDEDQPVIEHSDDMVNLYVKSKYIDGYYKFSTSRKRLFAELYDFLKTQLLITLLLIISITLSIYIFIRRNKLLALNKSKYLETLVASKTEELNTKISELHSANQHLKESENRLRTMFENNGMPTLLINPNTQMIEDANAAAITFYGYSEDQLKSMKISDINQLTKDEINAKTAKTEASGQKHFQFPHQLANGTIREVEVHSTAITIQGKPKLYSIILDITEREKAAAEIETLNIKLKNSNEELKVTIEELNSMNEELTVVNEDVAKEREQFLSVLDSVPEIIYVADMDTHEILFTNKKLKSIVGRDIVGEKCFKAIQNQAENCHFCTNHLIRRTNEPYYWEFFNPILKRHYYVMDRKISWDGHKEVRFELATDITERKENEEENKKLSVAVEQNPATIVITNPLGEIEYVNTIFTKQTGYTKEEALGHNPRILKSGKTPPNVYTELWSKITAGKTWKGLFVNNTKNGDEYIEQAIIAPIINAQKEITHYLAIKEDVTERVSAENIIKQNEAILRIAFENANIGIMNVDESGKILYVNTEATHIYGYSADELKSMKLFDINIPENKNISANFMKKAIDGSGKDKEAFEERYIHKSGRTITCQVSSTLLRNNQGEPLYFIAHIKDITKRKQFEAELLKSEEKYRLITENASDIIWIYNIDQDKFTYVSPSVYTLLGFTPQEAMTQTINEALTPESAKEAKKNMTETVSKFISNPNKYAKQSFINELRHPCKDGTVKWFETSTRYQYNDAGEVEVIGISRNIDERKKNQEYMASRLRYEENLANFSNALFHDTPDVITNNLKYILEAAQCSRVCIFENFTDEQNELSTKQVYEVCAPGVPPEIDNPNLQHIKYKKDGFERWQQELSQGRQINGIVSDFPLSERKLLEPFDIKSILIIPIWVHQKWHGFINFDNVNDEKKWTDEDVYLLRTASEILGLYIENYQNKRTIEKRNLALSEANATKDKFFSIVAHDLRSPFSAILGLSDLLITQIDNYDAEKTKRFVSAIHETGKNTFKLLENLLEWSRAQTGRIQFNPGNEKLYSIINEVVKQSSGAATAKQITITSQVDESIVVYADTNMLNTIFRNLISNSIKFTNPQGTITLKAAQKPNECLIEVQDTGIGMPQQTINKLFKIEEKVSRLGTSKELGSGLGLLLCKEFVEKHGGHIWAESTEGKGSLFSFTLPVFQPSERGNHAAG